MGLTLEVNVLNPSGLHARPAATFAKASAAFRSDIRVANVTTCSTTVNAKSIIGVLQLGVLRGHRIRLCVEGEDEQVAAETLMCMIEGGLGEQLDPA